jgi:hypothetical protein
LRSSASTARSSAVLAGSGSNNRSSMDFLINHSDHPVGATCLLLAVKRRARRRF